MANMQSMKSNQPTKEENGGFFITKQLKKDGLSGICRFELFPVSLSWGQPSPPWTRVDRVSLEIIFEI